MPSPVSPSPGTISVAGAAPSMLSQSGSFRCGLSSSIASAMSGLLSLNRLRSTVFSGFRIVAFSFLCFRLQLLVRLFVPGAPCRLWEPNVPRGLPFGRLRKEARMKTLSATALAILFTTLTAAAQNNAPSQSASPCQAQPDQDSAGAVTDEDAVEQSGDLTAKLAPCDGVLEPPDTGDDKMTEPAPDEGNTPIIKARELPQQQPSPQYAASGRRRMPGGEQAGHDMAGYVSNGIENGLPVPT